MRYAVVIEKARNNFGGAYVPDLPDCVATGDTVAEVETLIREAMALLIWPYAKIAMRHKYQVRSRRWSKWYSVEGTCSVSAIPKSAVSPQFLVTDIISNS